MNDMKTAPLDGTKVILYFKSVDGADTEDDWPSSCDVFISGYYVPPKTWNAGHETEFTEEGKWHVLRMNSHGCGCCHTPNPEPSGWLPIPKVNQ